MSRLLYVDCVGGVAGDMLLAALIDAGADVGRLSDGIAGLGVPGLDLRSEIVERHGVPAILARVAAEPDQSHRCWSDVRELVDRADLPERARRRAQEAFRLLARAEAGVHRVDPEQVEFHEVGAADALADVCGVTLALEELGIDRIACSPLPAGRGFVDAAHGRLPLPAPAVLELLRGATIEGVDEQAELVTPTGAALVTALADEFGPLPAMRLERSGTGAGARELTSRPNVVRVVIGEALPAHSDGLDREVSLIETNLDDLSPELVPDACDQVLAAGALDVWVTPVQMKKGRPGVVLSSLARPADEPRVAEAMLRETTALGVRATRVRRRELEREWRTVEVLGHSVRIKTGRLGDTELGGVPEHDDCAEVARRTGRPVHEVWTAALAADAAENGSSASVAAREPS